MIIHILCIVNNNITVLYNKKFLEIDCKLYIIFIIFYIRGGFIMGKILIVVDMQNDFVTGSLGTEEARGIVNNVCDKIKGFDGDIIFTRDTHEKDYLETQEGRNLPVEHCIRGTEGWKLVNEIEDIRKEKNYPVFDKNTFGSKDLVKYLEIINNKSKIDEIEIVGLCTDICVISNALLVKAFFPEIPITVDSSCCAGVTAQSHENALNSMKMCQIGII